MFILIETLIENNGSYDGPDFGFDTEVSFKNARFFSTKEEAIAAAKAEWEEKKEAAKDHCWFAEDFLHDTLTYEFYSKDFSGPEKIVAFKVLEFPDCHSQTNNFG